MRRMGACCTTTDNNQKEVFVPSETYENIIFIVSIIAAALSLTVSYFMLEQGFVDLLPIVSASFSTAACMIPASHRKLSVVCAVAGVVSAFLCLALLL